MTEMIQVARAFTDEGKVLESLVPETRRDVYFESMGYVSGVLDARNLAARLAGVAKDTLPDTVRAALEAFTGFIDEEIQERANVRLRDALNAAGLPLNDANVSLKRVTDEAEDNRKDSPAEA